VDTLNGNNNRYLYRKYRYLRVEFLMRFFDDRERNLYMIILLCCRRLSREVLYILLCWYNRTFYYVWAAIPRLFI